MAKPTAVLYARYSSELQSQASIEDQIGLCRALAERLGCKVGEVFADRALSAASSLRPGYQALLASVRSGAVDLLLAESLDRLSRDQEDVAALYKRLSFLGVRIVTVAEGEIGELHVGLKGAMNALYLKDLAQKTRRGLAGRVRAGRSAGGLCYGYEVVHEPGRDGPVRGGRRIVAGEAAIVHRIFTQFADGSSPKAIAKALNGEGVAGPRGELWRDTTIRGHRQRGTGVLNNELYIGRLIWNRLRYVKDPSTGKRVSRRNEATELVVVEVPELRILNEELWQAVKQRKSELEAAPTAQKIKASRFWERRRAQHLMTGLLTCGVCGGGYASVGRDYLACANARKLGTCGHRTGLRRPEVEELILDLLRDRLLAPEAVAAFVAGYSEELNRTRADSTSRRAEQEQRLAKLERKLQGFYDAIAEGLRTPGLLGQLQELETERERLLAGLAAPEPTPVRLHPNLPVLYGQKVAQLREALADPSIRDAALGLLRGLITRVVVRPGDGCVDLMVEGALTAMLALGSGARAEAFASCSGSSVKLVAGAGFEPATFRL